MSNIMGDRIKELRKTYHLTQDKLASELNDRFGLSINKSMISKWENGKGDPYLSYAKYLALHLSVNLDWLVGLTDEKQFVFYFDDWYKSKEKENELRLKKERLLSLFDQLNSEGQEKVSDYLDDLVASGRYAIKDNVSVLGDAPVSIAAHKRTDIEVTDEMLEHDMKIMLDDDF